MTPRSPPLEHSGTAQHDTSAPDEPFASARFRQANRVWTPRRGESAILIPANLRYSFSMKTLLTAIDFSDVTDAVLDQTRVIATAFEAKVFLVHVAPPEPSFVTYEPGPPSERAFRAKELREEHRQLQALAEKLAADGGPSAEPLMVSGGAVAKILEEAERLAANMIVLGSHGHGALYELLVGSVADGVMRKAKCPVLVVPARK